MDLNEKTNIIVLELAHFSYSHESFNAGAVWQYAKANPGYKICYCAERDSVERVQRIIPRCDNIDYCIMEELDSIRNNTARSIEKVYVEILDGLFSDRNISRIIITGYDYHYCDAFVSYMSSYPDTEFYFFMHGEIECLLDDFRIKRWGRYRVNKLRYRLGIDRVILKDYAKQIRSLIRGEVKRDKEIYIEKLEKLAQRDNAWFYVFSDEYLKYDLPLSNRVVDRFIRIHLPYVFDEGKTHDLEKESITRFLVCSSTAESRDGLVWKIINYVNRNRGRIDGKYEFVLGGGDCRCMKNTVPYVDQKRGQKDLHAAMEYCNWLLLPYPQERYRLSASGVLTDAIDMGIPVIMGESGCFNEAETFGIGMRGKNAKDIGEIVISIINRNELIDYSRYTEGCVKLKKYMYEGNLEIFKIL